MKPVQICQHKDFFFPTACIASPHNDLFKISINLEERIATGMETKKPKIPLVLIKPKDKEANPALPICPTTVTE